MDDPSALGALTDLAEKMDLVRILVQVHCLKQNID